MMAVVEEGQVAYTAYRDHTNGRSLVSGEPIPEWEFLPEQVKAAWQAAGEAVARLLGR